MLIPLMFALHLHAATTTWKEFARTRVAWRPGAPPYELLMEESVVPRDSDPDHRIRIRVPGRPDFTVVDARGPGEYVPIREALKESAPGLLPRALSGSARVLVLPVHGPRASAILAVFGWAYASDPNELTLIGFDESGYPGLLFRQDFHVHAMADLDADRVPELIGNAYFSEKTGECRESYDPFVVYRFVAGTPRYDPALSRRYNAAHYVWAGPGPNEKIEVDHCTPGVYRVVRPDH